MPKITRFERQTKSSNCGAFGLAAICKAFGSLPTDKKVVLHHRGRSATLEPSFTVSQAAEEIYKITGDYKISDHSAKHTTEGEDSNSPSAISYVAKQLGLYVILNAPADIPPPFLNEISYCETVADQRSFFEKIDGHRPGPTECQLILVRTSNDSYHWLAVDSDDLIYDPATGTQHADWFSLSNYTRLPVWVTFSGNAART